MKVGILTLPLHTNYGGNLQAFALMHTLNNMGHDPWLINRGKPPVQFGTQPYQMLKRAIKKYIFGKRTHASTAEREHFESNTKRFIETYISPQTPLALSSGELQSIAEQAQFDAIVVGSDQVWRPQYTPELTDYFLDFLSEDHSVKRIAYAASFGTDDWQFSDQQTAKCSELLKKFNYVSVRENSAVELCQHHLHTKADQALDPTLLVEPFGYEALFRGQAKKQMDQPGLFYYLLDNNPQKKAALLAFAEHVDCKPYDIYSYHYGRAASPRDAAPPVEDWINCFINSDYVLTDSFHGCVFSILFNKPFIAYGNQSRGLARFHSLLDLFSLRHRLVSSPEEVLPTLKNTSINWLEVNAILAREKEISLNSLQNALS